MQDAASLDGLWLAASPNGASLPRPSTSGIATDGVVPVRRLRSATASSITRDSRRLANVPSAHRSLVTTGKPEWHHQTPSYARLLVNHGAIGAPGQDLRRLAVGPSLYLNGPPDKGSKATLATMTAQRRDGNFGKTMGPGNMITLLQMHPPACRRSMAGPDPYDTSVSGRAIGAARLSFRVPRAACRMRAASRGQSFAPASARPSCPGRFLCAH
jgi:hypothetical protein